MAIRRINELEIIKKINAGSINLDDIHPAAQTHDICLAAVRRNGLDLSYVIKQTEEICIAAVHQNSLALPFVETQTEDICLAAIASCGMHGYDLPIWSIEKQTETVCLAAIRLNGWGSLRCIRSQTDLMCISAIEQNPYALEYVKNQTKEICLKAVELNGLALKFVNSQNDEICLAAVRQNGSALEYVKSQTEEVCMAAVMNNPSSIRIVKKQTEEMCLAAVKKYGVTLKYVFNKTDEICLAAIDNTIEAFGYTCDVEQTPELIKFTYNKIISSKSADIVLFNNYIEFLSKINPKFLNYEIIKDIYNSDLINMSNKISIGANSVGLCRTIDAIIRIVDEAGDEELLKKMINRDMQLIFNGHGGVCDRYPDLANYREKVKLLDSIGNIPTTVKARKTFI